MDPVELGEPDKVPAVYRAERAVIEAAEAYHAKERHRRILLPHEVAFFDAIEATQAARGE